MQNKKMTNPTDGINESNKKLRAIYEQLCCLTSAVLGNYNSVDTASLLDGEDVFFNPGEIHNITWELATGASVQINNGDTTTTFASNNSISFSTLNTQTITMTAIGGTVNLIYTY